MAKFKIIVEDNDSGVSISLDNHEQLHGSAAGHVVGAMINGAKLLDRIPLPMVSATPGCTCEVCQAYRELLQFKPTLH